MTDFPGLPTDIHTNTYDYTRYAATQMTVTVCSVPWDVGLVKVGNSVVQGLGNVVKFADRDALNSYIDSASGYSWDTMYRDTADTLTIDIPLSHDNCRRYNYIRIKAIRQPGQSPYNDNTYSNEYMYYFIRSIQQLAPNTCRATLMLDAWQTLIYDVDVSGVMLVRGHAACDMAANVATYLKAPVSNTAYLLDDDIKPGSNAVIADTTTINYTDGTTYIVFATTGSITSSDYDSNTYKCPQCGYADVYTQPQPVQYVALLASSYTAFVAAVIDKYPQWLQTVQGVLTISGNYLTRGTGISFCGYTLYPCSTRAVTTNVTLTQASFAYPAKYEALTKLYTYPYAYLELSDATGSMIVHIDTLESNTVGITNVLGLFAPVIRMNTIVTGPNTSISAALQRLSSVTYTIPADYHKGVMSHTIPVYGLSVARSVIEDYGRQYTRDYEGLDAETRRKIQYNNANNEVATAANTASTTKSKASNTASMTNSQASNTSSTLKSVTSNNNDNATSNCDVTNTAQYNKVATGAMNAASNMALENEYNSYTNNYAQQTTLAMTAEKNEYTEGITAANNAALGATAGVTAVSSAIGGVVSALTGNVAGVVGAVTNVATTAVNAQIEMETNNITTGLTVGLSTAQAANTNAQTGYNAIQTNALNTARIQNNNTANLNIVNTDIETAETVTANNCSLATANTALNAANTVANAALSATNTVDNAALDAALTTDNAALDAANTKANADLQYNTAMSKITANYNDSISNKPVLTSTNNTTGTDNIPDVLNINLKTLNPADVVRIGDDWLRHGYSCHAYIVNPNWISNNRKYTYWQCDEVMFNGLGAPDEWLDTIRFLLIGGVTVWKDPADIGQVTIYENI